MAPSDDLEVKQVPLPRLYLLPLDDGLQMGLKHVEVWYLSKVKINSASCWFVIQM
jgi:hypothetical protein